MHKTQNRKNGTISAFQYIGPDKMQT